MIRDGRTYDLGHKAHIAADVHSDLPLAFIVDSANEKKHAAGLLDKTVEATGGRVGRLVTCSIAAGSSERRSLTVEGW